MNNKANCPGKPTARNDYRGREKTMLARLSSSIAGATTMPNKPNLAVVPRGYRSGVALIWTALVLVAMLGVVGLAIDVGWAALDLHDLQNAGDAGALAGAMVLKQDAPGVLGPYVAAQLLTLANRAANEAVDVHFDAATNDATLDVVVGRWWSSTRTFEPLPLGSTGVVPNAVMVVTRHVEGWHVNQPLPLIFGPLFNKNHADLRREAIAICTGGGGAALVCLDPENPGIEIEGGAMLYVNAGIVPGEIYVNSELLGGGNNKTYAVYPTSQSAPDWEDGWIIDCAQMNVVGRVEPILIEHFSTPPDNDYYPILERVEPIPDPLRDLPPPGTLEPGTAIQVNPLTGEPILVDGEYVPKLWDDPFDVPDLGPQPLDVTQPITHTEIANYGELVGGTRQTLTLIPGYYSGGIHVTSSGGQNNTVRMLRGVYALGGGPQSVGAEGKAKSGLQFYGGALDAEKVMVYMTQSDEGNYGSVDLASYEYINMTEYEYRDGDPEPYKLYDYLNHNGAGMCIFQDRSSPMNANIQAGGGGMNMTMSGTIYIHNDQTWDVQLAVGGSSGDTGIQIITDRVLIHGDANITITYDGRNFQPAAQSLLVK